MKRALEEGRAPAFAQQVFDITSTSLAGLAQIQQHGAKRSCLVADEQLGARPFAAPDAAAGASQRWLTPFTMPGVTGGQLQQPGAPNWALPAFFSPQARPQLPAGLPAPGGFGGSPFVQPAGALSSSSAAPAPPGSLARPQQPEAGGGDGGSLLAQLQAQLQLRQQAAAQAGSWAVPRRLPLDAQPLAELELLLPAINAEYKAEMRLLLKACQVARSVSQHSAPGAGAGLLLDPAAREQLTRQVLGNCNDKHGAVAAAFKVAAQALATASSGGKPAGLVASTTVAAVVAAPGDGDAPCAGSQAAVDAVLDALQALRSGYQQELVAATSALFAICRGFGQGGTPPCAGARAIKQVLAQAQEQHGRVEQLWQDLLIAAGGSRT